MTVISDNASLSDVPRLSGGLSMLPTAQWPPDHAILQAAFVVLGDAKPAGSKVSGVAMRFDPKLGRKVPVLRENGSPQTFTKDSSGGPGKAWRQEVAEAAMAAWSQGEPLRGVPLVLEVVFVRPRPSSHYGTGRNAGLLKDSAPAAPITRPDALKLARAIEDSLTSIIWHDDSQVVDGRHRKVFGSPARAEIRVWSVPAAVATTPQTDQPALELALA